MKQYKYTGVFRNDGHSYELTVSCNSFIQAFFLLTADAIRSGRHYQLEKITDEKGDSYKIGAILGVSSLFKK